MFAKSDKLFYFFKLVPWGVDSLTKTNCEKSHIGKKDIDKVRAFCENAQAAAKELGI